MEDHERLARLSPAAVSVQYDARMLMGAVLIPVSNCLAFLIPSSKIALVLPSGLTQWLLATSDAHTVQPSS